MSIYFCIKCQMKHDSDFSPVHKFEGGEVCEECWLEEETTTELERVAKQTDSNSVEIMELDKRVKKLEGKNEE